VSVPSGASQSNNIYVDAFNEIDLDSSSADEASMDDRLEDNHNASSTSYPASYTIISPANPLVVASARHVSTSLASQAQAALPVQKHKSLSPLPNMMNAVPVRVLPNT
jgi:hypothetical protein